jgi:hypothetical protein
LRLRPASAAAANSNQESANAITLQLQQVIKQKWANGKKQKRENEAK